jgi:glutathione peroxidase-family protein
MNALAEKYGDKVNILAFPCNQVHYPALRQGVSG